MVHQRRTRTAGIPRVTRRRFLQLAGASAVAVAVITGPLGKDPGLARYIAERVSHRTRDVRQAIHVAQLCDTQEEVDRFESGAEPGRML